MNIPIISPGWQYYNEVHARWLPVPPHWYGVPQNQITHRTRPA